MVGIQLFDTTKITSLTDSDRSILPLHTHPCFLLSKGVFSSANAKRDVIPPHTHTWGGRG